MFDLYVFTALDQARYFDPLTGAMNLDLVFEDEVLDYVGSTLFYDADGSGEVFAPVAIVRLAGRPDIGAANINAEGFVPA